MSRWFIVKSVTTKILFKTGALRKFTNIFVCFPYTVLLFLPISAKALHILKVKALHIFLALFQLHANIRKNRNIWFQFSTASLLPWGASDLFQKSPTYNKVFIMVVFHPKFYPLPYLTFPMNWGAMAAGWLVFTRQSSALCATFPEEQL
jgi:hypothetical protein